jgi:hypothetical protein
MKRFTLELTDEEAILTRDALTDTKHALKNSPSERGKRLSAIAGALADELRDKLRRAR